MVKVAIAGGTGIWAGQSSKSWQAIRDTKPSFFPERPPLEEDLGVPSLAIDYGDVDALKRTLEENQIHTVISALGYHGDSLSKAQLNLLRASAASAATKRFVPSAYAVPYPKELCAELPTLHDYFGAIDELRRTDLQWTVFLNGIFLDYFGWPPLRSHLKPNTFAIDVANKAAAIPGDGNVPVTFTYTFDVARFVVAALDLDEWPEESRMAGDVVTWNEFLKLAEEARGSKFSVVYDDVEKLKRSEITELPGHAASYEFFPKKSFQWFMAIFEQLTTVEKTSYVPPELNAKFPDIKPLTVRGMLDEYWRGK